uniref:multiple epidermal growth factor-like domains protein 11 n=1 Tax=Styela clava TaxID=7725 RepID=UPI001939D110|nr:multiple epidermal growth factor-like domains protein 11 [Styela clava]XP_039265434.1 multiple epidermal growth factor-like domains protein 11 [Styela clava]
MRTKMAHILNSVRYTYPTNCSPNLVDIVVDEIYKDGTSICLAAIHDGQITAADGGDVIVNKRLGQSGFSGSTRNGVTSISGGSGNGFDFSDCINGSPTSSPSTGCSCTATWFGDACNIMCVEGSYNASNNPACICNSGWVGPLCNFRRFYILLKIILFSN